MYYRDSWVHGCDVYLGSVTSDVNVFCVPAVNVVNSQTAYYVMTFKLM